MKVGWFSTRDYDAKLGGAEQSDKDMWGQAPDEVTVELTNDVDRVMSGEFDKVVISGMRGLAAQQIAALALIKPAIWAHDMEYSGHWVYTKADPLICLTPQHRDLEIEQNSRIKTVMVNPGWFDTQPITTNKNHPRRERALWAHRPVAHKGLDRATEWADDKGIKLVVHVNSPKELVYWEMEQCRYFVLLSYIFDPGPHSVIEAHIAGCELVLDNVGYFDDLLPEQMRETIDGAGEAFWEMVLS